MKITLRDIILGGQDGLVNVLGLSLGLFASGANERTIIIAGLAAGFSEAISIGAVAYTSARADKARIETDTNGQLLFSGFVVGLTALLGACIPIIPFLFLTSYHAILLALVFAVCVLFALGATNAKSFGRMWWKSGIQVLIIGIVSALAGFGIGLLLK